MAENPLNKSATLRFGPIPSPPRGQDPAMSWGNLASRRTQELRIAEASFWVFVAVIIALGVAAFLFAVGYAMMRNDYNWMVYEKSTLETTISELGTEIDYLRTELGETEAKMYEIENELEAARERLTSEIAELDKTKRELGQVQQQLATVQETLKEVQGNATELMCDHRFYCSLRTDTGSVSCLIRAKDNGYIIAQNNNSAEVIVTRLSMEGTQSWRKTFAYPSTSERLLEQSNRNIALSASSSSGSALLILSPAGDVVAIYENNSCLITGMVDSSPRVVASCKPLANDRRSLFVYELHTDGTLSVHAEIEGIETSDHNAALLANAGNDIFIAGDSDSAVLRLVYIDGHSEKVHDYVVADYGWAEAVDYSPMGTLLILAMYNNTGTDKRLAIVEHNPSTGSTVQKLLIKADVSNYVHGNELLVRISTFRYAVTATVGQKKMVMLYDYNANDIIGTVEIDVYDPGNYRIIKGNNGEFAMLARELNMITAEGKLKDVISFGDTFVTNAGGVCDVFDDGYIVGFGNEITKVFPWRDRYFSKTCAEPERSGQTYEL